MTDSEYDAKLKWRLKQVGVELVDDWPGLHRCKQCGQEWNALLKGKGRYKRGYWRCPRGCNSDLKMP